MNPSIYTDRGLYSEIQQLLEALQLFCQQPTAKVCCELANSLITENLHFLKTGNFLTYLDRYLIGDIIEPLVEIKQLMCQGVNINLQMNLSEESSRGVWLDRVKLQRIVLTLFSRAIESLDATKGIFCRVSCLTEDEETYLQV